MPSYTKAGKILQPITKDEFEEALLRLPKKYKAFCVFLYYSGVRVSEALKLVKEDFKRTYRIFDETHQGTLYVDVGQRLKHSKKTQPLPLGMGQPHMELLMKKVLYTRKGQRVFQFTRQTAWNQISRAGLGYNHRMRLTAITFFLSKGYTIADIQNWFGISVQTINSYIGLVNIQRMGEQER